MSNELIKYGFVSGELSPSLFGRTDLTKYDLGMALAKNWFIDYRGGLTTRPGTEFVDFIKDDDKNVVLMDFAFSPDLSNTYVIMFGHNYIRFIQDGGYVLTGEQSITSIATTSSKVVVTKAGHGLSNGDWVKLTEVVGVNGLNGHTFVVANITSSTFELTDPRTGALIDRTGDTYVSGGKVSEIYEIASPYSTTDLENLKGNQIRDYVRLTHPDYMVRNLVRAAHDSWSISEISIGGPSYSDAAWGLAGSGTAAGAGDAQMTVIYSVAAINGDGIESTIATPIRVGLCKNFSIEQASVKLTWNAIPGATDYIIYRSILYPYYDATSSAYAPVGAQLGYVGSTKATTFVDSNIIPDFTKSPYENYNPFSPGPITSVTVTAGGSGYSFSAPVTITGSVGGSDYAGYAIVDDSGVVTSIVTTNRGKDYEGTLTVAIGGGGSGATATATAGELLGTYPTVSTIFQQRQLYMASLNHPMTLWASRVAEFENFNTSEYLISSDSYEFEIDGTQVSPILHFKSLRGGLLMLSQTGIWLLLGSNGGAVTPTDALADPQSYTGVSAVPPLQIGSDLLYIEGKGYSVRLLSYNDFSKVYSGEDKSILSNHLFNFNKQMTSWSFAENPYKLVFGTRSDGALIMFTTVKEQDVYAWTWGETRGWFKTVITVPESGVDTTYTIVEREIEGSRCKYLERFKTADWTYIEDAFCVDSGLAVEPETSTGSLNISAEFTESSEQYVTLTTAGESFTGKEGYWVRAAGGIFVIWEVTSSTVAKAKVLESATDLLPQHPDKPVVQATSGEWSLAEPVKTFYGLQHLEGEEVSILGDGSVFPKQTVTGGKIVLPAGVSKARVGLGFEAVAKTLPPTAQNATIEGRRKRIVGISARLDKTRGLLIGRDLDNLYPIRERTNAPYGSATKIINGFKHQMLQTEWDEDGQTYFVQSDPLPAAILVLIPDIVVGDDTD